MESEKAVKEVNTVFPRISGRTLISALPRISAHPLGQNSK